MSKINGHIVQAHKQFHSMSKNPACICKKLKSKPGGVGGHNVSQPDNYDKLHYLSFHISTLYFTSTICLKTAHIKTVHIKTVHIKCYY